MQLLGQEKEETAANCTNSNPMQASSIEMSLTTEPESNLLLPNMKDISYDNSCENDSIPHSHGSGRPTSFSSVTSSRTSRGSDYFSSSSAIESHQTNSHFDIQSDSADPDASAVRPLLNKVVEESVHEEDEEGFVDDNDISPNSLEAKNNHMNNSSNKLENERVSEPTAKTPSSGVDRENGALVSPKDINKKLSEVDYLSPIATLAMIANPNLSYVDRVIIELLETERMYVRALEDILAVSFVKLA